MVNFPPQPDAEQFDLPIPDDNAIAHSSHLVEAIVTRIKDANGRIGFNEFMQMALYEPGLGYYSSGTSKFGAAGDFVTAPEISSLFGSCLARQAAALIEQGCDAVILEFGAGTGKLCADILQSLPALERYLILDLSADLRQRQQFWLEQELCAELFHKIEWLEGLPAAFDGIVIANEVLDAMPFNIMLRQTDGWLERGVGFDGQKFHWVDIKATDQLLEYMCGIEERQQELPPGYCTEVNLNYQPWMKSLAQACGNAVILMIDYGYEQAQYYHPQRSQGTRNCYYQHRVHDNPLIYPGLQDITAFVDFDACADAAEAHGLTVSGLVGQGRFLIANGLLEVAQERSQRVDSVGQLALSQQVKTLSLPQEMGERFKVLALQKDLDLEIPAMHSGPAYG